MNGKPDAQPEQIVMGVDPGSVKAGIAVIRSAGGRLEVVSSRTLRFPNTERHEDRLVTLHDAVAEAVESYSPIACGIETPVYGVNPSSMLKLGRAQAAAILAARSRQVPIFEFMPKAVKKAITGNGNATKEQVAYMLRSILATTDLPESKDETDAIAVAASTLSHLGTTRSLKAAGQARDGLAAVGPVQQKGANTWSRFVRENPERVAGRANGSPTGASAAGREAAPPDPQRSISPENGGQR